MADDIDIEEHDVLESLRRRQIPDAVVKQELIDEEYSESHYQPSNEYHDQQWDWESRGIEPAQIKVEKPDETDIPFGKIILGSKPPESREEIQPPEADVEEIKDGQDNYNYNMSLILEDWGPKLEASNCYCPECEILFATVNALDAHKMIAHSFLVAMDGEASPERNKAIKSTAKPNEHGILSTCEICKYTFKGERAGRYNLLRHYRQVHQIDALKLKSVDELKNWKVCNHCNVYFPSDTALVKHLYELLPLNDNKKDDKPTPVKVQGAVKAPNDKVTPKILQTERKPVEADPVPSVSSVDTIPTPKPIVVKTVKPTPKQANSIILGSKINGVRVDVKKENVGVTSSKLRQCEVCGIEYTRKYYIKHMRKFHSDVLMAKMKRLKKIQPAKNADNASSTNVKYKCMMCHLIFDGSTRARKHKAQKHPEMKRKKMFLKIVPTNKMQKIKNKPKVLSKVKKPPQNEDSELIVSKSTLFKCNRCSVHFLTCYGACVHSRVCETSSNMRDWSCPKCQRVFKNVDKKAHEFQHQIVNAKFKVYVVYLEMVVRILCECPCCYVCFEEYKFWRHVKFGCERDTESFFCNECRLPIDTSSKVNHESKHTQGDFTKEDFIKVDFISSNKYLSRKAEPKEKDIPVPALKRKLAAPAVAAEKISKKAKEELNLFYCPSCKSYVNKKVSPHSTGDCKNCKSVKHKISCKICGISFTPSACGPHLRLHRKYPNLTLSDLTFTRMTDDKKMKPIPEYYPCKNCHVNFLAKTMRRKHDCGNTKSFNCQVCQKKIEKSSFKMHMRFHNYVLPGKKVQIKSSPLSRESEVKSPTKLKHNEPKSTLSETELPELLMKYQSLTTLWNILYVCATCDTFTDSYDKVVEHCQNHFTNMESYGVVIMKCQICNMKFDRECYRRHLELHAGGNDISKKSFKILRYDHAKLFLAEWLNFIDLPEDQKTQILTRSMYGEKRYVRMRLEQQGPPEYTLYRCKQCRKCISSEAIIHHMTLTSCTRANKLVCPICSMIFANRTAFGQHQKLHDTTHLEADSFRIVAFNDSIDSDLNKKILNEYNAGEVVVTAEPPKTPDFFAKYPDNVKLVKGNKFYMFYKCSDCEVCTLEAVSADHVCPTAKKICPKCGLTFSSNHFNEHTKLHQEIMFSDKNVFTRSFYSRPVAKTGKDTTKNNFAVVQTEIRTQEANLFKCHCGLHFTSLKTIEKHYQSKNCSSVVREKCSHCSLVFDPNEIVNHLCKHHAKGQFQRFKIVIPNKKTVYKCKQCHVLFYDKRIGGVHSEKCDGVSNGTKCDACGLAFDKLSIDTHREEHKASGQSKLDCYLVENITNDAKIDNNVLYKCKKCNIHYIEQTSARSHVITYNHQTHRVKKCDQCSLRFTVKTLPRHVELHHNMLKIDRFRIKCIPIANKNNAEDKLAFSKVQVNKETIPDEDLDIDVESEMVTESRTYKIHKCKKCKLHFTDSETLLKHYEDRCSKELNEVCELCSLKFAVKNMNTHKQQHNGEEAIQMDITEENNPLSEDLEVDDDKNDTATEEDEESRNDVDMNLYKCKNCSLHFNVRKSAQTHMSEGCKVKLAPVKCDECNVSFTRISATRHQALHDNYGFKKEDFNIIYLADSKGVDVERTGFNDENSQSTIDTAASLDSSVQESSHQGEADVSEIKINAELEAEIGTNSKNETLDAETSQQSEADVSFNKTKLYKCGDCNVYFIAQRTCYKHVTKHTPLNPKDYIECKLCGFQFLIAALQTHIKKHHADEFKLDDVLVQEYHPGVVKDDFPEYEIYFAIDKEQSALVSTSSDVNNDLKAVDTRKEIENDCSEVSEIVGVDSTEVSSNCNELNEKIDALDKT